VRHPRRTGTRGAKSMLVRTLPVKENLPMAGTEGRKVYALRPAGATKLSRVPGVLDLLAGVVIFLIGPAFVIAAFDSG